MYCCTIIVLIYVNVCLSTFAIERQLKLHLLRRNSLDSLCGRRDRRRTVVSFIVRCVYIRVLSNLRTKVYGQPLRREKYRGK